MIFAALLVGLLAGLVILDGIGQEDSRPAPIPVKPRGTPVRPAERED